MSTKNRTATVAGRRARLPEPQAPPAAVDTRQAVAADGSVIPLWLMIAYAVIGIGISIYLTSVHYAKVPLACPATAVFNCAPVLKSAYSVVGSTGVPITIPGMAWFVVSAGLAGLALWARHRSHPAPEWLPAAHLIWGVAGLAFILYLVYCEAVKLHVFCEWCTGVHFLVVLTFLTALFRWQRIMAVRYRRESLAASR